MSRLHPVLVAFALAITSCGGEPCEPVLCVAAECDPFAEKLVPEGDVVVITYALPAGIVTDERVSLRIETPCACVTFSRTPRSGGSAGAAEESDEPDESDEADESSSCDYGPPLEIAIPMPKGGACRLTVTAELLNSTRSVTLEGGECQDLACDADVKCTGDLSETAAAEVGSGGA